MNDFDDLNQTTNASNQTTADESANNVGINDLPEGLSANSKEPTFAEYAEMKAFAKKSLSSVSDSLKAYALKVIDAKLDKELDVASIDRALEFISTRLKQLDTMSLRHTGHANPNPNTRTAKVDAEGDFINITEYPLFRCSKHAETLLEAPVGDMSGTAALVSNARFPLAIMPVGMSFEVQASSRSKTLIMIRNTMKLRKAGRGMEFKIINHGAVSGERYVNKVIYSYEIVRIK